MDFVELIIGAVIGLLIGGFLMAACCSGSTPAATAACKDWAEVIDDGDSPVQCEHGNHLLEYKVLPTRDDSSPDVLVTCTCPSWDEMQEREEWRKLQEATARALRQEETAELMEALRTAESVTERTVILSALNDREGGDQ